MLAGIVEDALKECGSYTTLYNRFIRSAGPAFSAKSSPRWLESRRYLRARAPEVLLQEPHRFRRQFVPARREPLLESNSIWYTILPYAGRTLSAGCGEGREN